MQATCGATGNVTNAGANVANYFNGCDWNTLDGNLSSVGGTESASFYGTFDQAGNVSEWTERVSGGSLRQVAGGDFTTAGGLASSRIAAWRCYFETEPPTDPTGLWSTSHTPGVWSAVDVVDVAWSGAADSGGSGVAGYSVLWDTSPSSVPDDTVDVLHTADPHATASGVLADGSSHWFHLRTCDHAGNCSDGVHLGPFWIDTTAPSGPFDLTSTSHTPGEPTCDRTVDMVWTAATDMGSGLDGYAWAVTGTAAWACDGVKDLEEGATSFTTPELADWVWYVHLCASDNLGHWGEVVSAGPYPICPLFWDDFESGDTSAWSAVVP